MSSKPDFLFPSTLIEFLQQQAAGEVRRERRRGAKGQAKPVAPATCTSTAKNRTSCDRSRGA